MTGRIARCAVTDRRARRPPGAVALNRTGPSEPEPPVYRLGWRWRVRLWIGRVREFIYRRRAT
jgi:hypothetical protein